MRIKIPIVLMVMIAFQLMSYQQITAMEQEKRINTLISNVLKIHGDKLFNFGPRGFGVHDSGAEKFIVFDWNFNIIKEIPVKIGEGPGEIKQRISSACWLDSGQFILHDLFDRRIHKYDKDGTYIESIPLDFSPMKVLAYRDKIYIVNQSFEFSDNSNVFLQVLDSHTGETLKKVKFLEIPDRDAPPVNGNHNILHIGIDREGVIYFLYGATATIYKVNNDGRLLAKIPLPYKDLINIVKKPNLYATCVEKEYSGISIIGDTIYTSFMDLQKDYSGKKDGHIYLVKIIGVSMSGVFKEKTVYGYFELMGNSDDRLYLFDIGDYSLISIKTSELKRN